MISFLNRKRIINVFLVITILIFAIVVIVIIFKDHDDLVPYQSELMKNIVSLKDIDLIYIIDNSTNISLKSKDGKANIVTYNFDLFHLNLDYKSKDYHINAIADKGIYTEQQYIKAYDNLTGYMDNMTFRSKKNGILEYDYKAGKGSIINGITVMQGVNSIEADSVIFDVNNNYIFFKDNVTVNYVPEK